MVKCVVSGCPNCSAANVTRGLFSRPAKRFFSFPTNPTRIKVWLAALRETDKQDCEEQLFICEDHFLPEDISGGGVTGDAIPIMPPCLDGGLGGAMNPWGGEWSGEEDQWAAAADGEEDEEEEAEPEALFKEEPLEPEPEPPHPFRKDLDVKPAADVKLSSDLDQLNQNKSFKRHDVSLGVLTQQFLQLLLMAPDGTVDLRDATASLQTRKRRVYDITNVLDGISLIQKDSKNKFKWIGKCPISSLLSQESPRWQKELQSLKLVEDTLDGLIKSCAQQLFDMTDDTQNSALAYVTHEDVRRLPAFREQTVIVVKAPEETKLEVPAPKEDSIQIHLKGGKGPIVVQTCDVETEKHGVFVTLEESRIKTSTLHRAPSPQTTTQSA